MRAFLAYGFSVFLALSLPDVSLGQSVGLGYPKQQETYPNPYRMQVDDRIGVPENHSKRRRWVVAASREGAPRYGRAGSRFTPTGTARYLEPFRVEERADGYLRVVPLRGRGGGSAWMKMTDLVLLERSIRDPKTRVVLKAFPLVRISHEEPNIDALRFRNGPGDPNVQSDLAFLTERSESIKQGGIFLYVYAVAFDSSKDDAFHDFEQFKYATHFLVGINPSFNFLENGAIKGDVIKGWIPATGAVPWDTRQALEVEGARQDQLAHIFTYEEELKRYFSSDSEDERSQYLTDIQDNIVSDGGESPPSNGQDLRYIVLDEPLGFRAHVKYANIGYTGQSSGENGEGSEISSGELQMWGRKIEIFFLIDATTSMKEWFSAAARVVGSIQAELSREQSDVTFYAAVYRDRRDGVARFVEWDRNEQSLSNWLAAVPVGDPASDPTYEESLYYAMKRAARNWTRRFENRIATRVLLVIGDAGNESADAVDVDAVAPILKKNLIVPWALHFNHVGSSSSERSAIAAFPRDLNRIYSEFLDLPIKIESVTEQEIRESLDETIRTFLSTFVQFIRSLADVRLGQRTIIESLCDIAYSGQSGEQCKKVKNLPDLIGFDQEQRERREGSVGSPGAGAVGPKRRTDIRLPALQLMLLGERSREVQEMVYKHPQMAYAEGFVATRVSESPVTRPVYLFSQRELIRLSQDTATLTREYANCDTKEIREHLVLSMATVLGEALQVNPRSVTVEDVKRWFPILIEPERSSISAKDLVDKLCDSNYSNDWDRLLSRLEQVPDIIADITSNRFKERRFVDTGGLSYYWVYPEEVFPPGRPGALR